MLLFKAKEEICSDYESTIPMILVYIAPNNSFLFKVIGVYWRE